MPHAIRHFCPARLSYDNFCSAETTANYGWVGHCCWSVFTHDGVYAGRRGSQRDITVAKVAEQARKDSEQRHRAILQTAMDGFWTVDLNGRILEVNERYCLMGGYPEAEIVGKHIWELDNSEEREDTLERILAIVGKSEARFERVHRRKDGTLFEVEISAQYKAEGNGYLVCFLRDITELNLAERAIKETEERSRRLIEASADAILIRSPMKISYANAAAIKL